MRIDHQQVRMDLDLGQQRRGVDATPRRPRLVSRSRSEVVQPEDETAIFVYDQDSFSNPRSAHRDP
jgi:hypothetical protein